MSSAANGTMSPPPRALVLGGVALALVVLMAAVAELADRPVLLPGGQLGDTTVEDLAGPNAFPKAVVDPAGRRVVLDRPPTAIASVILGGDEMLARLVAPSRVRSITYLADDPGISNVSGVYPASVLRNHGGIEEVIAAEPDLAIVAAYTNAVTAGLLLDTGIAFLRFVHFDTHDDIRRNVRTLARAVGSSARGEAWLDEMDRRIAAVQTKVADRARPRVLYYSLSGSTAGPGSLMDETITFAGGDNVIAGTGLGALPRISPETVISLQPEVILLSGWSGGVGPAAHEVLLEDPAWRDVPAVRDGRVYSLSGAWITSVSPHRVGGVEEVAKLLHPRAFEAEQATSAARVATADGAAFSFRREAEAPVRGVAEIGALDAVAGAGL
ncbi:MAG: ABC transporter substrate-binding protein [Pseudomonadota bacterium]